MKDLIILSVVYLEPEWLNTKKCIDRTGLPVHYVERNPAGVGSLAEAINRGFREIESFGFKYVWVVTNITFEKGVPFKLRSMMDDYAIVHPSFSSDHYFCRPDDSGKTKPVPFVEFTSPMIKSDTFIYLDENMPYWGHDQDYGYRMWERKQKVGVNHAVKIDHTYIRKTVHYFSTTLQRHNLRKATNRSTKEALARKYGDGWRWMFPRTEKEVEFYNRKMGVHA